MEERELENKWLPSIGIYSVPRMNWSVEGRVFLIVLSLQPPEPQSDPREEESKNEEKMERKAKSSISEESRRKAETTKEYKVR